MGTAGQLTAETDKIFKNLLIVDSLRGVDSTGVAAVDRTDEVRVVKQVGNPFELMNMKVFDNALARMNRVLIGHNRFATQGLVTKKNAHPFDFENVIGAHNGTLTNKHRLLDSKDFIVDSENIFHHINEEGLDSLLNVMEGAWSLTWWDKREHTLNFLRNSERPMFLMTTEDGKKMFWASEQWMLNGAADHSPMKFGDVVSTKVDTLYSFHINAQGDIEKPHVKPAPSKVIKQPVVYGNNWNKGKPNFTNGRMGTSNHHAANQEIGGRNVISLKNKRVVPQTAKSSVMESSPHSYSMRKSVLLEVLTERKDDNGASYYICFDAATPKAVLRLYCKRNDIPGSLLQKEIIADIGMLIAEDKAFYYKVVHSSVKLAHPKKNDVKEESAGKYFMDARGTLISKDAWLARYSKGCCWCTAGIMPEDSYRFTETKEILCSDCEKDSEITQYVTLQ